CRISSVRNNPNALGRNSRISKLRCNKGRGCAVEISHLVFFAFAGKEGIVVNGGFLYLEPHPLVLGPHNPHPVARWARGVVQHGSDAKAPRGTECCERLAGHRVNKVVSGYVLTDPSIETRILPCKKRASGWTHFFRKPQKTISDQRTKAMRSRAF